MARQDEEFWMLKIAGYYESDINTRITAINTEKGNDADMKTLASNAFYYGSEFASFPVHDPFIVFDLDINGETGQEQVTSGLISQATMLIHLVYSDTNKTGVIPIKLKSRYKRALYEVVLNRHNELNHINYDVVGSVFDSFDNNNKFYSYVTIGLEYQIAY